MDRLARERREARLLMAGDPAAAKRASERLLSLEGWREDGPGLEKTLSVMASIGPPWFTHRMSRAERADLLLWLVSRGPKYGDFRWISDEAERFIRAELTRLRFLAWLGDRDAPAVLALAKGFGVGSRQGIDPLHGLGPDIARTLGPMVMCGVAAASLEAASAAWRGVAALRESARPIKLVGDQDAAKALAHGAAALRELEEGEAELLFGGAAGGTAEHNATHRALERLAKKTVRRGQRVARIGPVLLRDGDAAGHAANEFATGVSALLEVAGLPLDERAKGYYETIYRSIRSLGYLADARIPRASKRGEPSDGGLRDGRIEFKKASLAVAIRILA